MADDAIRRAAGVIMWHMRKGHGPDEAVAKASKREPHLSESELMHALDWASDGIDFAAMLRMAPDDADVWDIAKRAGLPVPGGGDNV
jgi:hypothetical protein